jgi:DNA polymerase-3 subunit alpha
MVASVRRIVTKTNRTMAVAVLEDLSGRVDAVLFPETFDRHGDAVSEGVILDVRGKIDRRGESLQIVCESIKTELPVAIVQESEADPVVIRFGAEADPWAEIRCMQAVESILQRHEGPHPIVIEVPATADATRRLRSRTRKVLWSDQLGDELRSVAGVLGVHVVSVGPARLAS